MGGATSKEPDYDKVVISQLARILGRRGAKATNARLSPQQRSKNARRAVMIRWKRYRERKGGDFSC